MEKFLCLGLFIVAFSSFAMCSNNENDTRPLFKGQPVKGVFQASGSVPGYPEVSDFLIGIQTISQNLHMMLARCYDGSPFLELREIECPSVEHINQDTQWTPIGQSTFVEYMRIWESPIWNKETEPSCPMQALKKD